MTEQEFITATLTQELAPSFLQVENESHQHNVPANSQTHFKVVCASAAFNGLRPVQRHQKVYAFLQPALDRGVHALALHLYSPEQWDEINSAPESPKCMGGSKR